MAKIGLVDVDGHNFPNLALMKISAYHKSIGDSVEWASLNNYDRTYFSKVFTFSPDYAKGFIDYGEIVKGGTGFKMTNTLPDYVDKLCPDYSIYPQYTSAYGFLTRGCPNNCSWCIVPSKEGNIKPYADIEEFLFGRKEAVLMDNNILAHEHGIRQIEKIIKLGIKIDFNQGLDARLIDRPMAKLLSRIKWLVPLRMSCDTITMLKHVKKAMRYLREYDCTPSNYFIYLLVKDVETSLKRAELLKKWGCDPFAQPFRDFETNSKPDYELRKFARYVNHKAIFKSIKYADYKP